MAPMLCCMVRNTPKALALGARLRAVREAKEPKQSQRDVAKKLGINSSVMSRYESGERPPGPEDVAAILAVLGVNGAERDEIVDLARDTGGTSWLAVSLPDQRAQLAALLDFEQMATRIVDVAPLLIPGLLQTASYARAIMREGEVPDDEVETRVAVRVGRRDILTRSEPTELLALVGEHALRAMIGSPRVMAEQMEHLLKMATLPNVDLRIVPVDSPWHPGSEGPFVVLSSESTSLVHLENRRSGLFLQDDDDLSAYQEAVEKELTVALDAEQTAALIAREAERIKRLA